MSKIVISHGLAMTPELIWYGHVAETFRADGHEVAIPALPGDFTPDPDVWLKAVTDAADGRAADTVLVGHSLGAVNLLRLLERHDTETLGAFAGVVLVAGMAHPVGYDQLAGFFPQPDGDFDWDRIRAAAGQVRVLVDVNDHVLQPDALQHVRIFVEKLGAYAVVSPQGGHFPDWSEDVPPALDELPLAEALIREVLPRA